MIYLFEEDSAEKLDLDKKLHLFGMFHLFQSAILPLDLSAQFLRSIEADDTLKLRPCI